MTAAAATCTLHSGREARIGYIEAVWLTLGLSLSAEIGSSIRCWLGGYGLFGDGHHELDLQPKPRRAIHGTAPAKDLVGLPLVACIRARGNHLTFKL